MYFLLASIGFSLLGAFFYLCSDKKIERNFQLQNEEEEEDEVEKKREKRIASLPGLYNYGNICFLNSTLQVNLS